MAPFRTSGSRRRSSAPSEVAARAAASSGAREPLRPGLGRRCRDRLATADLGDAVLPPARRGSSARPRAGCARRGGCPSTRPPRGAPRSAGMSASSSRLAATRRTSSVPERPRPVSSIRRGLMPAHVRAPPVGPNHDVVDRRTAHLASRRARNADPRPVRSGRKMGRAPRSTVATPSSLRLSSVGVAQDLDRAPRCERGVPDGSGHAGDPSAEPLSGPTHPPSDVGAIVRHPATITRRDLGVGARYPRSTSRSRGAWTWVRIRTAAAAPASAPKRCASQETPGRPGSTPQIIAP